MTREDVDMAWHDAMRHALFEGEQMARYRFAEFITQAERAEVARLRGILQRAYDCLPEMPDVCVQCVRLGFEGGGGAQEGGV